MKGVASEAFFLAHADGRKRFCLHHAPGAHRGPGSPANVRAVVLYLPPWADEMNKSRRMARLQSQLLAANGFAVLQVDLTGCGDSSGDHGSSSWEQWVEDGADALRWLGQRYPGAPHLIWGLRSGCLLACDVAGVVPDAAALLMWNPPGSGRQQWQQFLRLATAAALTGDVGKARADAIKQRLQQGLAVEIAGYEVSPPLWHGLESSAIKGPGRPTAAEMIEVGAQAGDDVSPALLTMADKWRSQGHRVATSRVQGPAFWQTTEIEDAPALLPATLDAALRLTAPPQPAS